MSRVVWDQESQRIYETGLDRVVLYTKSGLAVPWNGLIAVGEGSKNSDLAPVYFDGKLVRMDTPSGDFVGALKAFSSPMEFDECEGVIHHANGLLVTQQERSEFGLSYRTLIGSASDPDYGYKIHILYNVKADPASREHVSETDKPSVGTVAWQISTRAVDVPGMRQTSHFVFRSDNGSISITMLEDILYGTDTEPPRLPTIAELDALRIG